MKKIYTSKEEKLKEKQKKLKSEYASKARPNGPLNIYVAGMPRKNVIDWKQSLGLIQMQSANDSQDSVSAACIESCYKKSHFSLDYYETGTVPQ